MVLMSHLLGGGGGGASVSEDTKEKVLPLRREQKNARPQAQLVMKHRTGGGCSEHSEGRSAPSRQRLKPCPGYLQTRVFQNHQEEVKGILAAKWITILCS
jgi:hypothetical protein